ncbi:MAG: hypothetical protein AB7G87_08080 [Clostridia bacterium]
MISFPKVKSFNKYLSSILMISGAYLLIKSQISLGEWAEALVKNAGLTVLLLSVPLLSIIFRLEDFSSHISSFARKHIKSDFSFYTLTLLLNNFFGIILNVASFPMVHKLLENISGKHPRKAYYKALTRGFCLAQLWAPNFVVMAIVLQYSGLEWHSYVPVGILLSVIGTSISTILAKIDTQKHKDETLSEIIIQKEENIEGDLQGVLKVISIAVFLILFIIGFQYLSGKSILVIVPLASVIFPIALAVLLRKLETYKEGFKEYFNTILPRKNSEIILFTAVGFFGYALSSSGADKYIPLIIKSTGISNPAILIPFIILLIFTLSMIGFHPILTISAISIAYSAGAIPISQIQLAAVFSIGYFSYTLLSPFSGMILAVASLERKNPLDVGIKINLIFWVLFICISSVVIPIL